MAGYADLNSAMAQLALDDGNEDHAADIALLAECDEAVSVLFEQKAGFDVALTPIWGGDVVATAAARVVAGPMSATDTLLLPKPVRSVSGIAIAGDAAETLAADGWELRNVDDRGNAFAIRRIDGGGWPTRNGRSPITVTAVWSDSPVGGEPPAIVVKACTFLAVDEFRMRQTSPAGAVGLEGFTQRPRNPWNFELVKGALDAVRVPKPVVSF
jgi:hypothetical protein